MFLPALCHKMQVPFAIVRTKANLGNLVHVKTCSCVCLTEVRNEDQAALKAAIEKVSEAVNYKDAMKHYGGNTKSERSVAKQNKKLAKK